VVGAWTRRSGAALLAGALAAMLAPVGSLAAPGATVSPSPDHRAITPAGRLYATAGQFPGGATLDAAGQRVIVADANKTKDYVEAFDATNPSLSAATVPTSPPGAQTPDAQSGHVFVGPTGTIYAAGGATGTARSFTDTPTPVQTATYQVGNANPLSGPADRSGYIGDVVALADARTLVASEPFDRGGGKGNKVVRYDTLTGARTLATVGLHPLALAVSPQAGGRQLVAVANQDGGSVSIVDSASMQVLRTILTGRQPAALAFTRDGSRLLVVDSLDDELVVLRPSDGGVLARVRLSGQDGIGAEPSALALSADGQRAYVALSADNAVAVVRRVPGRDAWTVDGRIPTARYPTAVTLDEVRGQLLVTAGKAGSATTAGMPQNLGALEQIPLPDAATLSADSAQVAVNDQVAPSRCSTAALAPIKHVLYIIRENKTYDAELGDEPGGMPAYVMYGRSTTPNTHALAERFALLQNFTTDQEVSDTGHQVLMGGVSNDWVERFSEQSYNLGGAQRPGSELGNNDNTLWAPSNYLFDSALAAGISFRDYGEFYRHDQNTDAAISPALDSHIVHDYPGFGFDPSVKDTDRVAFWKRQFAQDVARGSLPQLEVLYLPEDHTTSGLPGTPDAQAQVADNDLATGQIVDALSHSPFWRSSAVFVAEDDPQDGMDHIDPHRSVGLVVGPHVRAGTQTAAPYDHLSMLRTVEQILGLAPLTAHDASARPMASLFDPARADNRPFSAIAPSPPAASVATRAVLHAQAVRRFGAAATPRSLQDRFPGQQFRQQWLATHGQPFRASAALPGPGPAAVRPASARALLARGARQGASEDCPAVASPPPPGGGGGAGGAPGPGGSTSALSAGRPLSSGSENGRRGRRQHVRLGLRVRHSGRRLLVVTGRAQPGDRVTLRFTRRGARRARTLTLRADNHGRFRRLVGHLPVGAYRVQARERAHRSVTRAARVGPGARTY